MTGDLRRVRDVDVCVNSENTDMQMSRIDDYAISAIIRYDGFGRLAVSHNVSAIVHVAAVYGEPGAGYRQIRDVGRCVTSALAEVDQPPQRARELSVLFPMLGTGQGRGDIERTAAVLVDTAADYLAKSLRTRIGVVWFLAHTHAELAAFQQVIGDSALIDAAAAR